MGLGDAPCVPALRAAVGAWRAGGYRGTTATTRRLLGYWFRCDHLLADGTPFEYNAAQREAIETLVFVWECEAVRSRASLVARYGQAPADAGALPRPSRPTPRRVAPDRAPPADPFARYAIKMATGSGKTKVMALAMAWQFLNAQRETGAPAAGYARTFLVLAPNVVVYERLRVDFEAGRIFEHDPVVPREMRADWDFDCVVRGDGERAHAAGTLFLTNVQQLYGRSTHATPNEPAPISAVLGSRSPAPERLDFRARIAARGAPLMVLNDEGHHTHAEDNEWNAVIRDLDRRTPVNVQLDLSATPRFPSGAPFPWTVSDYPLGQAIADGLVKCPVRGVVGAGEAASDHAPTRYERYLVAAVERWNEYVDELRPLGKKPLLFVMLGSTHEADTVGEWLRRTYPEALGGDRTLVLHTNPAGEITKAGLDAARAAARDADDDHTELRAIVSVLMLREGWDVRNVTVVVGLRAFSARSGILPEQAIGRGLRRMFRGRSGAGYRERLDVLGNDKFLELVDELEDTEGIALERVDLGRDRVRITTVAPVASRSRFDLAVPVLSPALVRRSVAEEIAGLDVRTLARPDLDAPVVTDEAGSDTSEASPAAGDPGHPGGSPMTTPHQAIGQYARRIAAEARIPGQFAALVPKVREYFESRFFGQAADLARHGVVALMMTPSAQRRVVQVFVDALRSAASGSAEPRLVSPPRPLSTCPPFPWSGLAREADRTIFNLVACEDEHESALASWLGAAPDVHAFAKLPAAFAFAIEYLSGGNLRRYTPDWIVKDDADRCYLVATRRAGAADADAEDRAARRWCDSARSLTGSEWHFLRMAAADFPRVAPTRFAEWIRRGAHASDAVVSPGAALRSDP